MKKLHFTSSGGSEVGRVTTSTSIVVGVVVISTLLGSSLTWPAMAASTTTPTPSSISSSKGGGSKASNGWCSRAVYNKSCAADIPTIQNLVVDRYMGVWYEIGCSASYKFRREPGMICNQAQYSIAPQSSLGGGSGGGSVVVNMLSTGIQNVGIDSIPYVFQLSVASHDACSSSRRLCSSILTASNISIISSSLNIVNNLAQSLASTYPSEAINITHMVDAMTFTLQSAKSNIDTMANWIQNVQKLNGQISQGSTDVNVLRYMKNNLKMLVNQHLSTTTSIAQIRASNTGIATIASSLYSNPNTANTGSQLLQASKSIDKGLDAMNGLMVELGRALQVASGAFSAISGDTSTPSREVLTVKGQAFITQNTDNSSNPSSSPPYSPGKLVANIAGFQEPYWIVAVEEGVDSYSAALVYSCSLGQPKGELTESLLILSRSRQLQQPTIQRFLSLAKLYGIYMECENPFIFTMQDEATCGTPPPHK